MEKVNKCSLYPYIVRIESYYMENIVGNFKILKFVYLFVFEICVYDICGGFELMFDWGGLGERFRER